MKINNEKGISHIMLFIYVVIVIMILGGILYYSYTKYTEEKLETLKTDMLAVQAKIKIISQEVAMKKEGSKYIGKKVSENLEDESIKNLIEQGIIVSENYENFYILENEELNEIGLKNYKINKVVVDYTNSEVINVNGFNVKEKTYYKLSDFKIIEEKDNNKQNVEVNENKQ